MSSDPTPTMPAPADPADLPGSRDVATSAGRLLEVAVADLALIDRLRLVLEPGFNVLSGETGAGKSLLIDALGLALGARADAALVRHGAERARVEVLFDRRPEPLIAVREVSSTGRSTARLDDESVTAARLAATTGDLVEIHGQHEQQRLLGEDWQRDLLDAFGTHADARRRVAAGVERWRANRAALAELSLDPRELARRLDLLEHEAAEISAAGLRDGEAAEITRQLAAAQHAGTVVAGAGEVRDTLLGEGRGARDQVAFAERELRALGRIDERWAGLSDRLSGVEAEIEDVASEVRALAASVDHDPAALAHLEQRLGEITRLERRYGDDEAAVIAHGERAAAEAERLRGMEEERARRAADDARLLAEIAEASATLSVLRVATAAELGGRVSSVLAELGFPADAFEVSVGRRPAAHDEPAVEVGGDALAFDSTGIDTIVFRFRPNPGEPARPLARIASGGELSRVALAVKQVLARADRTPTLVFDEVDAGIGGRGADPVGRSLWMLAREHQVLCVTHLPQIAAYADAHFRIEKHEREGRTVTAVERLGRAARESELALMIGGRAGGEPALLSARELLDRAGAWAAGRLAEIPAAGPDDGRVRAAG
jgi:DNA repair protein RecN (Recombination protein N)